MTPENRPENRGENRGENRPENAEVRRSDVLGGVRAGQRARNPENAETRLPKDSSVLRSPGRPGNELRYSLARPLADHGRRAAGGSPRAEPRYSLASRLTERDRAIVRAVARHRTLTAEQLTLLFFDHQKSALRRLLTLHRLGVLDRFQPFKSGGGVNPFHYVLGPLGAAVIAAERGDDPEAAARRWRPDRTLALARTQRLEHLVGINGLYARLASASKNPAFRGGLAAWLTESECARWTEGIVRPDAAGEWRENGEAVEFLLENDCGTETLARLVAKLDGYEQFESERGIASWVLFAFQTERREATARHALVGCTVAIATAVRPEAHDPGEAVWLPLTAATERVRLAGLARIPKPSEALRRAATGGPRAWRFDRSRYELGEEAPIEQP